MTKILLARSTDDPSTVALVPNNNKAALMFPERRRTGFAVKIG